MYTVIYKGITMDWLIFVLNSLNDGHKTSVSIFYLFISVQSPETKNHHVFVTMSPSYLPTEPVLFHRAAMFHRRVSTVAQNGPTLALKVDIKCLTVQLELQNKVVFNYSGAHSRIIFFSTTKCLYTVLLLDM